MPRRRTPSALVLAAVLSAACQDVARDPLAPNGSPTLGKTTGSTNSARYTLQFVTTSLAPGGEILTSAPFPEGGVVLNTKDPWRQMTAEGAVVTLGSPTNGTRGLGKCVVAEDRDVNWDIEGTPDPTTQAPRSFAGRWLLTVSTSRDRNGTVSFYLAGPRIGDDGVASASLGSIQNIASNGNPATETRDGVNSFEIEFTNARLGFGSTSSPDGAGTLQALVGYETACANFKLVATKVP